MKLATQGIYLAFFISGIAVVCHFCDNANQSAQHISSTDPADQRLLFSFEDSGELYRLSRYIGQTELALVEDNGVTDGQQCARLTVRKGAEYGGFELDRRAIQGWNNFDYLALDLFSEDERERSLVVELWDRDSYNYATRCTWENVKFHRGHQQLLYPIKNAIRNGKVGLAPEHLKPDDKIDVPQLSRVKIFLIPSQDHDTVVWLDRIRLIQEQVAKPQLTLPLPVDAIAYQFGASGVPPHGFQLITPNSIANLAAGHAGIDSGAEVQAGGEGWPDPIAGSYLIAREGQELRFEAKLKNGEYFYWLLSGPVYRLEPENFEFRLSLNDEVLEQTIASATEYYSEKYLYRFLKTPASEQPQALWDRFLKRMYPVHTGRVQVVDEKLNLRAVNHFVSALVLVPVAQQSAFQQFEIDANERRLNLFQKSLSPPSQQTVIPDSVGDSSPTYELSWSDQFGVIKPGRPPTPQAAPLKRLSLAGTAGERVSFRMAIAARQDLGHCQVNLSALKSTFSAQESISADTFRVYFQSIRYDGTKTEEMGLIAQPGWPISAGELRFVWFWLQIPAKCAPGMYQGQVHFAPENGAAEVLSLELEVYPFQLKEDLPLAYGMYYKPRKLNGVDAKIQRAERLRQFQLMREIGLTSVSVGGPTVLKLEQDRAVALRFDSELYELAKEAGLGRRPEQYLMASTLGMGRAIGRKLPGSFGAQVDHDPGIELRQPEFPAYFLNGARQFREFLHQQGLPVAVEIVDEPREIPNPWNRNLADTLVYSDLLHQAGLKTFVTSMADTNHGKDYSVLADHADIVSVHAWPNSEKLIRKTRQQSKTLWLYNTGMDRFSWGFYPWAIGAAGRWEWHFCWQEDQGKGGYPGRDGFNPFTGNHGVAPEGPIGSAIMFQSKLLDIAEGILDRTYLHTLECQLDELRRKSLPEHAGILTQGDKLLSRIRTSIPQFPEVEGLSDIADSALVGHGFSSKYQSLAATWRREIAELLKRMPRE